MGGPGLDFSGFVRGLVSNCCEHGDGFLSFIKNYTYYFYLVIETPDHVYVLGKTYTCHTDLSGKKNITDTHNGMHNQSV